MLPSGRISSVHRYDLDDVIEKLRELDLTRDKNAHQTIARFDNILATEDLSVALAFERNLLDLAKDTFALLSDVEHAALARLQEDRNRCAPPTFFSPGDVVQPVSGIGQITYSIRRRIPPSACTNAGKGSP